MPTAFFVWVVWVLMILPLQAVEIIKAPYDEREYRAITLSNGLEAVLISDPEARFAAASMNVAVGSHADPDDIPGLTHFLEHMLFLGSEKYPDPQAYGQFINGNGGQTNAFVSSQFTNYHFQIDPQQFKPALDRFAQFFIAPTFDSRYVERELNAVHAEYSLYTQQDRRREFEVLSLALNPKHPEAGFSVGNRETLGSVPNLSQRLRQHHQRYYSANLMNLVLLGRESLDDLQAYAEEIFAAVLNRQSEPFAYTEPAFLPKSLPVQMEYKPLESTRALKLMFPHRYDPKEYALKTGSITLSLLGEESPGSFLHWLQSQGLANALGSGALELDDQNALIIVSIDLTPKGLAAKERIIDAFFTYVDRVKLHIDESWRYEEQRKISDLSFAFQEKWDAMGTAIAIASRMRKVAIEDILQSGYLYRRFDAAKERAFAASIDPENMLIAISDPDLLAESTERWYGTGYTRSDISAERLAKIESTRGDAALARAFFMPKQNPFLPENVKLLAESYAAETEEVLPLLLRHDQSGEFWFLQDRVFKTPKIALTLNFESPAVYALSPEYAIKSELLTMIWDEMTIKNQYPASLADTQSAQRRGTSGLSLSMSGYAQPLRLLLEEQLAVWKAPEVSEERFEDFKYALEQRYANIEQSGAARLAQYEKATVTNTPFWHRQRYLETIGSITREETLAHAATIFEQGYLSLFIHGNIKEQQARELEDMIRTSIAPTPQQEFKPLEDRSTHADKSLVLDRHDRYVLPVRGNARDSAVYASFHLPNPSLRHSAGADILGGLMRSYFYNQLRTNEQLGYLVQSFANTAGAVPKMGVVIQSPDYAPNYIFERIDTFLHNFGGRLARLDPAEIDAVIEAMINEGEQPPESFSEATEDYSIAIADKDRSFIFDDEYLAALKSWDQESLVALYRSIFLANSRRVFVAATYGKDLPLEPFAPKPVAANSNFRAITDSARFVESHTYAEISEKSPYPAVADEKLQ